MALAWHKGGEMLAVVGWQKMVVLVDTKSGKLQGIDQDSPDIQGVAFSPDGNYLAVGRRGVRHGPYVTIYSLSPLRAWKQYVSPNQTEDRASPQANSIAFSASGRELLVNGYGSQRELAIFDLRSNPSDKVVPLGNGRDTLRRLAASPIRPIVAVARTFGEVDIVDIETQQVLHSWTAYPGGWMDHGWSIQDMAFSPDGRYFALSTDTGVKTESLDRKTGNYIKKENREPVKIYETKSWTLVRVIPVDSYHRAMTLSFTSDGQFLVAGTIDGLVVVWDAETGQLVQQKKVSRWNVLVKAEGRTIAAAGMGDRKLSILNLQ
jgi:WD40 repeat protein